MSERLRIVHTDTEQDRSIQDALDTVALTSVTTVPYTATGSNAATIDLSWGIRSDKLARSATAPPRAALVVRVVDVTTNAAGNPGNIRVGLNFEFVASTSGDHTVKLYEPEGLTANSKYELTILWVG